MPLAHTSKIAVIGAGPAGSFLSFLLAKRGFNQIWLFEKKNLTSGKKLGKVCGGCLHRRAVNILEKYGLTDTINLGIEIKTVSLLAPEASSQFSLQHGIWINRRELDSFLMNAALASGVLLINQQAKILDSAQGRVRFAEQEVDFDVLIDCGGIGGSALPEWQEQSDRLAGFGFQGYLRAADNNNCLQSILPGEVRFFIDDCGYHGVVRVAEPEPYFHVASYLRGPKLQTSLFLRQFFSLEDLQEQSATQSLYRKRRAAQGRVLLCGDALGYPEPFSGTGMCFALESAEILATLLASCSGSSLDDCAKLWRAKSQVLQQQHWVRSGWVSWIIKSSLRRRIFLPLMPYFARFVAWVW